MGGTSTDVSHFDGEYERAFETEVAGVRMRAPMMLIHTVAAGGGSILHFDGARFRVGPDCAGANPGPACYRRGGPLTVTDANVMAGKLMPDFFPKIFGPQQDQPLDADAVRATSPSWRATIGDGQSPEEIADGFIKIAVENMANAIKKISVQRGYDVTRYALNCFGGAGGQHACLVADALGMTKRADPSVLVAAVGLWHGAGRHPRHPRAGDRAAVRRQGARRARDDRRHARPRGQGRGRRPGRARRPRSRSSCAPISVTPAPTPLWWCRPAPCPPMQRAFEKAHKARFGFIDRNKQMVVEAVSVEAVGGGAKFNEEAARRSAAKLPTPARRTRFFSQGAMAQGQRLYPRPAEAGRQGEGRRPSSSSRTRPSSSSPAGRPN